MTLDEQDLRQGLKQIVGTWQVDYIVNAWSNDLAHIPATEFKSDDGRDFSVITFTFTEDHTVTMADTATGKQEQGTWEQTGYGSYHYTLGAFLDLPDDSFRAAAEKLEMVEGCLVFSLGFLAIGMKKIAEGTVTEAPDVGDLPCDDSMTDIVGRYAVAKSMGVVNDAFDLFTRDEIAGALQARVDAGEIEEEEMRDSLKAFDMVVEFTPDHKVITWMKLPEGLDPAELQAALDSGEISRVENGMFAAEEQEWKAVNGAYYFNTGSHRELFGEEQSPWDKLEIDEEGLLPFASGMMKLKRI